MAMRTPAKRSADVKSIAAERITILFQQAARIWGEHPELSDRYVELATTISTKYNVRVPKELRTRYCRKCKAYWVPARSVKVRMIQGFATYECLRCGAVRRFGYRKEKKENKKVLKK